MTHLLPLLLLLLPGNVNVAAIRTVRPQGHCLQRAYMVLTWLSPVRV
jgi:hypothetical protein